MRVMAHLCVILMQYMSVARTRNLKSIQDVDPLVYNQKNNVVRSHTLEDDP
jgi:hypothetical protein